MPRFLSLREIDPGRFPVKENDGGSHGYDLIRGIRTYPGISHRENSAFVNRRSQQITKRDRVTPLRGFAFFPGFLLDPAHILRYRFKRDGGACMCERGEGGHMGEKCRG